MNDKPCINYDYYINMSNTSNDNTASYKISTNSELSETKNNKKPTIRMCRFIHMINPSCVGAHTWKLEAEGVKFVVCDVHLAAGIRITGMPALVSSSTYTPYSDESKVCDIKEDKEA